MSKKIVLLIAFILSILVIFILVTKLHLFQSFELITNKPILEKNNVDISKIRNKSLEYFENVKDKQVKNADNYYLDYEREGRNVKYYRKNNFHKEIVENYTAGQVEYIRYIKNAKEYSMSSHSAKGTAIRVSTAEREYNGHPFFVQNSLYDPNLAISSPKYVGQNYDINSDYPCAIWQIPSKKRVYGQNGIETTTSGVREICVSEDLGVVYYNKFIDSSKNEDYIFKLNNIEVGNVKDSEFVIPNIAN